MIYRLRGHPPRPWPNRLVNGWAVKGVDQFHPGTHNVFDGSFPTIQDTDASHFTNFADPLRPGAKLGLRISIREHNIRWELSSIRQRSGMESFWWTYPNPILP